MYAYRHFDKIEPKAPAPAPELGKLLHDYLAGYYTRCGGLWAGMPGYAFPRLEAHEAARDEVLDKWTGQLQMMANVTVELGGDVDVAEKLARMPEDAEDMMNRYYSVRGRSDAEQYETVLVERPLTVTLVRGITSVGIIDLVTRDVDTGQMFLWEHKSTTSVPSQNYRFRDLQTTLYAAKLRTALKIDVDGVIWNYIRTVPPRPPDMLKSGQFSRAKNQDTCWYVYRRTVEQAGLDPADYEDMELLLAGREETVFFPRFQYNLVAAEWILLRDYVETAKDIRKAREAWAAGKRAPVRTLTRNCDWCAFGKICMAEVTGGDPQDIIELRYQPRSETELTQRTLEPA